MTLPATWNRNGGEEIGDDGVVVSGVERDVLAAGFRDGADDVEGLETVERCDLDGDDILDLGESAPERVGEETASDGGLEIKADDG